MKNSHICNTLICKELVKYMENMDDTNRKPPVSSENAADIPVPPNIFLIMEGVKAFPLDKARITIGRSLDNIIVVDDPRVSRFHAEIRVVRGNFMLFDLNSSGGTYLNGRRTSQGVLYPGDMISLAGVNFVFTQDTRFIGHGTEKPASEGPGKRDTVIFDKSIHPKDDQI